MEVGAPQGVTTGAGGKKGTGKKSEKPKKHGRAKDTKGGAPSIHTHGGGVPATT